MMTKKDYIRAAEIIRDDYLSDRNVIAAFVDFFAEDNPNFDEERFVEACKWQSESRGRRR